MLRRNPSADSGAKNEGRVIRADRPPRLRWPSGWPECEKAPSPNAAVSRHATDPSVHAEPRRDCGETEPKATTEWVT